MYNTNEYFGYELKKSKSVEADMKKRVSFASPDHNDGAITIEVNNGNGVGFFANSYLDLDGMMRTEQQLIKKYRDITSIAEVNDAIEQIINEAIVTNEREMPVNVILDDVDDTLANKVIKEAITEEFEFICKLLSLKTRGHDIFRDWYVDGKKYYHKVIDEKSPAKGIRELRPIDPVKMQKRRLVHKKKDTSTGIDVIEKIEELYLFMPDDATSVEQGVYISPDSIAYCPSGISNTEKTMGVSYLYKAIRPANQLRMMEDALVIYRIARAPERRVFYIDVGSLPKAKAEQYLETFMRRFKNKFVYDATTGEVRNDKNHMSMLEDYYLPRREGSNATSIETIGGGQHLGEVDDIIFFQKKLLRAMDVPVSRLEPDTGFSMGKSSEITRDEIKFNKFIARLRSRFSELFFDLLGTQLILKKIMKKEEWEAIKKDIYFDYVRDSHFTEMKNIEITQERLNIIRDMEPYVGIYFSEEDVKKDILQYDDKKIKELNQQNKKEAPERAKREEDSGGGRGGRF